MSKSNIQEKFTITIPKDVRNKINLKEGEWLRVKAFEGKELVLVKPKRDYWDETFSWGTTFVKEKNIKPQDISKAIRKTRQGK